MSLYDYLFTHRWTICTPQNNAYSVQLLVSVLCRNYSLLFCEWSVNYNTVVFSEIDDGDVLFVTNCFADKKEIKFAKKLFCKET